jgi:hypothetical protein
VPDNLELTDCGSALPLGVLLIEKCGSKPGFCPALSPDYKSYSHIETRGLMNDALLFAPARKSGLTLLTRNISDFDLLQQLEPKSTEANNKH